MKVSSRWVIPSLRGWRSSISLVNGINVRSCQGPCTGRAVTCRAAEAMIAQYDPSPGETFGIKSADMIRAPMIDRGLKGKVEVTVV